MQNTRDLNQRDHGTEVTSIIVDGPKMNPWLDDGCGRFRVRHFGVCSNRISTIRLVKKIKNIVHENPDIHVWNLSLGTEDEVSKNFVSFDAAALDEIQTGRNVIFVVSGTNDNREVRNGALRVGSPANSLNALQIMSFLFRRMTTISIHILPEQRCATSRNAPVHRASITQIGSYP